MFKFGFPKKWTSLHKLIWLNAMSGGSPLPWSTFVGNPLEFDAPKAHSLKSCVVTFADSASGYTGASIYLEDEYDGSATPIATVTFPNTIYGGSFDFVSGIGEDENGNQFTATATAITSLQGRNVMWTDGTELAVEARAIAVNIYGTRWDMVNAQMTRTGDAAEITTNTANFGHFGSVNPSYSNPFDSIYPWSGRKLCNIDMATYRSLTAGVSIKDCVTHWEGEDGFSYTDEYGVWVYTPEFWGTAFDDGGYRYFNVADGAVYGYIHYPESIAGRWLGTDVTMTIDGTSKHVNLPKVGMPMANVSGTNMHQYAKNYNASLMDIYTLDALSLLYIVEYANANVQNSIGGGIASWYKEGATNLLLEDVTASTVIKVDATAAANNVLPNAIMDIGTSNGGNQVGRFTVISTEVDSNDSSVLKVTLDRAVTATTANIWSIHGGISLADEGIGSHSGYLGTNNKSNAYYRGQVFYANKFQYILGAYRETSTGAIWVCDRDTTDNYDALNTSAHHDTGLLLPTSSNYVKKFGLASGFAFAPFATESGNGAGSNNPIGDYVYVPALTTDNTVLWFGGHANSGTYCGFSGNWSYSATTSSWAFGSCPRLKNP